MTYEEVIESSSEKEAVEEFIKTHPHFNLSTYEKQDNSNLYYFDFSQLTLEITEFNLEFVLSSLKREIDDKNIKIFAKVIKDVTK